MTTTQVLSPNGRAPNANQPRYALLRLSLGLGAIVLASAGCFATVRTRGTVYYEEPRVAIEAPAVEVRTVAVESPSLEVESYPSYLYGGANVYLVDGQWYRSSGGRWVVYSEEPRALASVRVGYETRYGRHYHPGRKVVRPSTRRPGRR